MKQIGGVGVNLTAVSKAVERAGIPVDLETTADGAVELNVSRRLLVERGAGDRLVMELAAVGVVVADSRRHNGLRILTLGDR